MSQKIAPYERVYEYMIKMIKSKQWEQGMKIASENELSSELDVSRVAVRQASERLVALGLLNRRKGSGTYVNIIKAKTYLNSLMPILLLEEKDIFTVLEFRQYFEYGNVKMFIENFSVDKYEQLVDQYNIMKKSINKPSEFYIADSRFHSIIAEGTVNPISIKMNEILMDVLVKHQSILYTEIGPEVGLAYHEQLLRYINKRDKELAALFMMRHIEAAISDLRQVVEARNITAEIK